MKHHPSLKYFSLLSTKKKDLLLQSRKKQSLNFLEMLFLTTLGPKTMSIWCPVTYKEVRVSFGTLKCYILCKERKFHERLPVSIYLQWRGSELRVCSYPLTMPIPRFGVRWWRLPMPSCKTICRTLLLLPTFISSWPALKTWITGWWDGSSKWLKAIAAYSWQPEFFLQKPYEIRRQPLKVILWPPQAFHDMWRHQCSVCFLVAPILFLRQGLSRNLEFTDAAWVTSQQV